MARIAWRGELKKLRMRIENLPEEKLDQATAIMEDVVKEGEALIRHYVETRGTERSGKSGRVETGTMRDSVESAVFKNPRSVRGEFGWGVKGGRVEDYFRYQETGFRHYFTGENVPPLHAQIHAFIEMREEFFRRMRQEMGVRR